MTGNLSIIVAMAENRCIGKDNQMPWHISADLKRFKKLTLTHTVIMGRKTFESILGYLNTPLPGRQSIVISRSGYETEHDVPVISDISEAINLAKKSKDKEIFIIGGAEIYNQTINLANKLYLTKVHKSVEGDAFFPEIDEAEWEEIEREDQMDHNPPYSFVTLVRR
ncbi:MAG: dihydrofolate reductase [Alphaproteobacteria bacterium]|nr:dihydrofolate reductase [Alphaproteobacteria bacterium]